MAFETLPTFTVDKAIDVDYLNQIKANEDDLNTRVGTLTSIVIPNGNFEIDSDADGFPDNWTKSTDPVGGSVVLDATAPIEGAKSLKFTRPSGTGNTGGVVDSDYIPFGEKIWKSLAWLMKASAAGPSVKIKVRWYDKAKVYISESVIYNSTANPTSLSFIIRPISAPSGTGYFKIRIAGGEATPDVAASIWFDAFTLVDRSGIVEAITLAECSTYSTGYVDLGNVVLPIQGQSGDQYDLRFYAEHRGDPNWGTAQRFRVGTYYVDVSSAHTGSSYGRYQYVLRFTHPGGDTVTLYMQGYTSDGRYATYGRIDAEQIAINRVG